MVEVDEGKLPLLVRRLTAQEGAPPQVLLPPPVAASAQLGRGGAALLWLAARVYADLGAVIDLPARLPEDLLDMLRGLAQPEDLAVADAAAKRVQAALASALQGRVPFPVWTQPTLAVAESLALIARALAEDLALDMDYYTAGRDVVTHRVVAPYRIEQRSTRHGEEPYLIGFCYRAQAERVFRVDRIRALALVPLP